MLTLSSSLRQGELWRIHGRVGNSMRTYHGSATTPVIEIHDEGLRVELNCFGSALSSMTGCRADIR